MIEKRLLLLKKNRIILIGIPVLFVLLYLYPHLPWIHGSSLCVVNMATNMDCPGCGITRSLSAFINGNFYESVHWHQFGVLLFLGLVYLLIRAIGELLTGKTSPNLLSKKGRKIVGIAIVISLIGCWLIRLMINGL